ncbi:unnamed protein product, partial [Phaeothamnion confervicola]
MAGLFVAGASAAIALPLAMLISAGQVAAQGAVAEFYKGKTVTMHIGFATGGEYDLQGRLISRFLGRHIPGGPTIIASQMTGAGTITLANYLTAVAVKDGSQIAIVSNGLPSAQAIGTQGIAFDARKLFWIGTIAPVVETMAVWHTTGVRTLADAQKKEVIAGATSKGSITYTMPVLMNDLMGTKFKMVTGYRGGSEINLAMEREEVGARNNSWSSWTATKPQWLADKKLSVIAYEGPQTADLSSVPRLSSVARNDEDRQVIKIIFSGSYLGRPLVTTPGVPADRVAALRDAFDATMKDAEFRAAAAQAGFEL